MAEPVKVKIKGIRNVAPQEVDLSKFFEGLAFVMIKPLPVPARAKIQELMTNGTRYATKQSKKSLDINAIEQAMPAETVLEIRKVKLAEGVVEHNLVNEESGEKLPWNEATWDALDEANPSILSKVIDAITELTYPDDEDGKDPT